MTQELNKSKQLALQYENWFSSKAYYDGEHSVNLEFKPSVVTLQGIR
jgi:hypothetical protein